MYIRMALLAYAPVLLTTVSGSAVAALARAVRAEAISGVPVATAATAPPSSVLLRTAVSGAWWGVLPVLRAEWARERSHGQCQS